MVDTADRRSGSMRAARATVSWAALYAAIVLDVAQVFALDYSDGGTRPVPAIAAGVGFLVEVYLFAVAVRRIRGAVAQAMFGLGTAAVAVISIGWLGEPFTVLKAAGLLAVIVGAVLLNATADLSSPTPDPTGRPGDPPARRGR